MKKIWKEIEKVKSLCEKHGDFEKTKELFPEGVWGTVVDHPAKGKVIFFYIVNNKNKNKHNVLIGAENGMLKIWCGDQYIQKLGYRESPCWFWRNAKTGRPHCKHVAFVIGYLEKNPDIRKKIEEILIGDNVLSGKGIRNKIKLAIKLSKPILLFGPTGSGKTHEVLSVVKEEGFPLYQINITNGLEDIDLLKKTIPDPDTKGWKTVDGELLRAFRHAQEGKVVILLEEVSRSSKSLRNLLIKTMDKKFGKYMIQDFVTGEEIEVPAKNIVWIATANLGSSYGDTVELDPALMRRFPFTVFVDYDTKKEMMILKEIVDEDTAKKMVEFAKKVRENYLAGRLPYPLDTGTLVEWAEVTREVEDPIEAAELTFLYRIVERDSFGYPEKGQIEVLKEELEALF